MQLFIAGLITSNFTKGQRTYEMTSPNGQLLRDQVSYYLESYHYMKTDQKRRIWRGLGKDIFLDSGAFSAFSLGVTIDINEYAEFIKEHQALINHASVLDAIGDPVGTFHNQKTLEKLGVEVLPCYHFGEPLDLCEYYVRNYPYITIGGMVPIPNARLEPWLDEIWDKILTDKDGYARCKVHGFGLTSRPFMSKYPWFSCDSSSWIQLAFRGNIVFPEIDDNISISARSPNRKQFDKHFNTLPSRSQKKVLDLLEYYGLTIEEVRDTHHGRWALNSFTYDRIGKNMGEDHWKRPFTVKQGVLF